MIQQEIGNERDKLRFWIGFALGCLNRGAVGEATKALEKALGKTTADVTNSQPNSGGVKE